MRRRFSSLACPAFSLQHSAHHGQLTLTRQEDSLREDSSLYAHWMLGTRVRGLQERLCCFCFYSYAGFLSSTTWNSAGKCWVRRKKEKLLFIWSQKQNPDSRSTWEIFQANPWPLTFPMNDKNTAPSNTLAPESLNSSCSIEISIETEEEGSFQSKPQHFCGF